MFRALPSLRPSLALYAIRTFATTVPANLVKQLRDSTGAPMMECKNALLASDNDVTKAVDWLRKKGKAAAMKSAGRTASQGLVAFAVNAGGNAGALIELNSETDFVARNALFQALAGRVAVSALEHLPQTLATTSEALGSEASLAAASTLLASPLVGGQVGGAGEGGCSVGEGVTGVIAQVRENMVLRRAVVVGGEGCLVTPYVHNSPGAGLGSIGVLVALRLKGKGGAPLSPAHPATPALQALSRRLAMHIAAANPQYLNRQDVPPEALERERAVLLEQGTSSAAAAATAAAAPPKSPELMKKIIEGKLGKFFGECVLKEQTFALGEDSVKVEKWLEGEAKTQGLPPVEAVSFATFRVGAGGGSGNAPASA